MVVRPKIMKTSDSIWKLLADHSGPDGESGLEWETEVLIRQAYLEQVERERISDLANPGIPSPELPTTSGEVGVAGSDSPIHHGIPKDEAVFEREARRKVRLQEQVDNRQKEIARINIAAAERWKRPIKAVANGESVPESPNFRVVDGSPTQHCCFVAAVVTADGKLSVGEFFDRRMAEGFCNYLANNIELGACAAELVAEIDKQQEVHG